jgi:hypothetical protein
VDAPEMGRLPDMVQLGREARTISNVPSLALPPTDRAATCDFAMFRDISLPKFCLLRVMSTANLRRMEMNFN